MAFHDLQSHIKQSYSYSARMVEYLEQDQIQSFKEAFDSFDSNDNGKVSSHCLKVSTLLNKLMEFKILICTGSDETSWSKSNRCRDPGYCQQSRRRLRYVDNIS